MKITKKGFPYICKHCKKVVYRESDKQLVKSYCEEKGMTVHLIRIPAGKLADK